MEGTSDSAPSGEGNVEDEAALRAAEDEAALKAAKVEGKKAAIKGCIWFVIGAAISVGSYIRASNSGSGGRYLLTWGALLVGIGLLGQGLYQYMRPEAALRSARARAAKALEPLTDEAKEKQAKQKKAAKVVLIVCGVALVILFTFAIREGLSR